MCGCGERLGGIAAHKGRFLASTKVGATRGMLLLLGRSPSSVAGMKGSEMKRNRAVDRSRRATWAPMPEIWCKWRRDDFASTPLSLLVIWDTRRPSEY